LFLNKLKMIGATNIPPIKSSKVCKTIVVVGSCEVGKTNLLQRYTKRRFEESYIETIGMDYVIICNNYLGVDYFTKEIQCQCENTVLSIWDTCGMENELKILPTNIYKVASSFVIVCSYDKKESFDMLKIWIKHIMTYLNNRGTSLAPNNSYLIPIVVLINKCDIKKERKFQINDVLKSVDEFNLNIVIYEVSAKENVKLDYVFEKIVGLINGKISIANECNLNVSCENEVLNTTMMSNMVSNRRRSFQLQEQVAKVDRDKGKQVSCCN
jgi:small GTP-binding protein